jgi:hypothetical protein
MKGQAPAQKKLKTSLRRSPTSMQEKQPKNPRRAT